MVQRLAAVLLLLLSLPIIVVVAALISVAGRHTPFFRHSRIGAGRKPFAMIKFRTMRPETGHYLVKPPPSDPAITPVGALLRRRGLDELPQLLHVITGKMALVGPRPEMPFVVDEYGPTERLRLRTKPGITGLWQLSGCSGKPIHLNIEYDLFYVFNKSPFLDLWLLWRTLLLVVFGITTRLEQAVQRWERKRAWRTYVPGLSLPRQRRPRLSQIWALGTAAAALAAFAPSLAMAAAARSDLSQARAAMVQARDALGDMRVQAARKAIDSADRAFGRAAKRLSGPATLPPRLVPPLKENFETAHAIAAGGSDLARAGRHGLEALSLVPISEGRPSLPFRAGVLDVKLLMQASAPVKKLQDDLTGALRWLESAPDRMLLPPVRKARMEVQQAVEESRRRADAASGAAFLLPRMFGAEGARAWIIAAQNNAELRGRGGYLGSIGRLQADQGAMQLEAFRAMEDLPPLKIDLQGAPREYRDHLAGLGGALAWQNLTMSPHFPSGAGLLLSHLKQDAHMEAQGLIAVDPIALSYLLDVTGPVAVKGIPEPLTAANFTDWSLNRLYFQYEVDNEKRRQILSLMAEAVWRRTMSGEGIDPKRLSRAIGRALQEGHIYVFSLDPDEQSLIERLGIGGSMEAGQGDYLMVLGQNTGENKMDYYLRRQIAYRAQIKPDGSLQASVDVTIRNTAQPGSQLPAYIGGARPHLGLPPGVARTYFSIFTSRRAAVQEMLVDGKPSDDFETGTQHKRAFFGTYVDLAPGQAKRVIFRYKVPEILNGGAYRLTIQNQATVTPDAVSVVVDLPNGRTVSKMDGFRGHNALQWSGPAPAAITLRADIKIPIWEKVAASISHFLRRPLVI